MGGCTGKPAVRSKNYARNENNNPSQAKKNHIGGSKQDINAPNSFLDQILRVNGVTMNSGNGEVRECNKLLKGIRAHALPSNIVPNQIEGQVKLCEINNSSILSRRAISPLKPPKKNSQNESSVASSDEKDTITNKQQKISTRDGQKDHKKQYSDSSPTLRKQGVNRLQDVKSEEYQEPHIEKSVDQWEYNLGGNCINQSVNLKEINATSIIEDSQQKIQQLDVNTHMHQRSTEYSLKASSTFNKSKHAPPKYT